MRQLLKHCVLGIIVATLVPNVVAAQGVARQGAEDGTVDGLLIGAVLGAGAGLGAMAITYANVCETCDAPAPGPMFLGAGAFGAGAGALTGWLIDKLHKGKSVVFPAVSPIVTARRKGVALSWRF